MITVHGRTREQAEAWREYDARSQPSSRRCASGGERRHQSVKSPDVLAYTGADAVMIGRWGHALDFRGAFLATGTASATAGDRRVPFAVGTPR
jgi:tRNA-dihydrouridine synthase